MDYRQKKIVIVGAGLSGQALVRFFCAKGAKVSLSDQRTAQQLGGLAGIADCQVHLDLGSHDLELFRQAELIVVSPGVPLTIEPLLETARLGIPLLGEVEIAARELTTPLIGVTGTNGKSTTSCLIGEILIGWGQRCFVGGNLGTPLITACEQNYDSLVVELSSFQLETIESLAPDFALMLNLSEDHLDRYPDFASYMAAKQAIFGKMGQGQYAILNADDHRVCELTVPPAVTKIWFSASGLLAEGMGRCDNRLCWRWQGQETYFELGSLALKGEHNIENAMAALIAPLVMGVPAEIAWQQVCRFTGLAHRMQQVSNFQQIDWINDSKATNVASLLKSLSGLAAPVTLIAGGKDKGGDYAPLCEMLRQKVASLLLLGEAAERMTDELHNCCSISRVADMAEAVKLAAQQTAAGGTVLLSPACSSFDMYSSYAARGEDFTRLVQQLEETP